jgi:NAD(P)-dependent dehydrogenase (short-subunit alcohol dehydrogenase family)
MNVRRRFVPRGLADVSSFPCVVHPLQERLPRDFAARANYPGNHVHMPLHTKVAVITGGSGGLGRAAAIAMAERGATVVVVARRPTALAETVRLCEERGGIAYAEVADVTRPEDLERVVALAVAKGRGRIDVWVNNAGATAFGPLEMPDFTDHRRVIEVNLFGAIHGARAVLPVFRRQGHGVLINVGSVLSKIGQPFVPSYVISKFALDGLTEALRAEVADQPDIHVCSLSPYAMNTPHFENGANHVGRQPHAMPPAQSPEKVARVIADLAARPRRNRYVPRAAVIALAAHVIAPRAVEQVIHDALTRWHFSDVPAAEGPGSIHTPVDGPGAVGGTRPPLVSAAALVLWSVGRLCTLELAGVARRVRRLGRSA